MPKKLLRQIYLVRHAKSSWHTEQTDFNRPLNHRGLKDAPEMGRRLAARGIKPDLMISSSALRALTTAEYFAEATGYNNRLIQLKDELYLASTKDWLKILSSLPDECRTVMVFGHNPGITELVQKLAGLDIANMPTCSVVELNFQMAAGEDSWALLENASLLTSSYDFPKNSAPPIKGNLRLS